MHEITNSNQSKVIKQELNIRQWSEIIKDCQNSDQSIRTYCKQHGLSEGAYYYWQKVIREKACSSIPTIQDEPFFVPVSYENIQPVSQSFGRVDAMPFVSLCIQDIRIDINTVVGIEQLSNIIKAVRSSC